eukprot:scaffold1888_cov146-Skeletonema_menzelii.AAC.3
MKEGQTDSASETNVREGVAVGSGWSWVPRLRPKCVEVSPKCRTSGHHPAPMYTFMNVPESEQNLGIFSFPSRASRLSIAHFHGRPSDTHQIQDCFQPIEQSCLQVQLLIRTISVSSSGESHQFITTPTTAASSPRASCCVALRQDSNSFFGSTIGICRASSAPNYESPTGWEEKR